MESFRPEYSGGRITEQDCTNLLLDINGCPLTKTGCDKGLWFFCGTFLTMAIFMPVYMVTAGRNSSEETFATNFGLGFGLIIGLGMISIVANIVTVIKRIAIKELARKQVLNVIIKRHNEATWSSKQAVVNISPYGGFISIQFLWVAQQPMIMMAPQILPFGMMGGAPPMMQQ